MPDNDRNISALEIQDAFSPTVKSSNDEQNVLHRLLRRISKCWFVICFCLAIIVILAQMKSHSFQHPTNNQPAVQHQDNAEMMQLAEEIVQSCSLVNIKSEEGRGECQEICRDHSCCFSDEEIQSSYGCSNDVDKMCSVYIGCETLFAPYAMDNNTIQLTPTYKINDGPETEDATQQAEGEKQPSNSEMELISHVISTVCANDNLHTHQGAQECADLCNSSMCCFNRTEIYTLNPHVDVILKLEGVSGDRLDTSTMGTCMLESLASLLNTNHFCQAHFGCKNLLLFGSARRQPLSGTFTNDGIDVQVESEDDGANEQLAVIHILVSFCIMISLAIYLLIYQRLPLLHHSESTESENLIEDIGDIESKEMI